MYYKYKLLNLNKPIYLFFKNRLKWGKKKKPLAVFIAEYMSTLWPSSSISSYIPNRSVYIWSPKDVTAKVGNGINMEMIICRPT